MEITAFINGSLLGGALIIAIGAQNMFVLRQGLVKDQVFVVALISSIIDASLIILGALGLGTLISSYPLAIEVATLGGAAFLIVYGLKSLYGAFKKSGKLTVANEPVVSTVKKAALMTLAFGLLNPHVYLDTVILLGGIASTYEIEMRYFFVSGAVLTSFAWFFTIGYGARLISPLMTHPYGARILDLLVATMMFIVAGGLISDYLKT